ncbi:MAG: fibronectin type III domain-containing protein [Gemmatimonadota bacterium]|nr:fibronectin type III domain-containing protein [Gemmatimonadota bacterium]
MRNLVSLAVASLLLLPAFGARADGSVSGDEARPGSSGGEVSPDRASRAVPTVTITFEALPNQPNPHDDFKITFTWSELVDGFTIGDITVEGARTTSTLNETTTDMVWTVDVETDEDLEGEIVVTVREDAVTSQSTSEGNDETTEEETVDNKAPGIIKAWGSVQTIVLIYHEEIDDAGNPSLPSYDVTTVGADGATKLDNVEPTNVRAEDDTVTLTLAATHTIHPGDTIKLDYTRATNPLADAVGNKAAEFTDSLIDNLRKITLPGPVENLSAEVTDTSIQLDWDQPTDTGGVPILGYRVEGRGDGGNWEVLQTGTDPAHNLTEYLHLGLSEGESWEYEVRARNVAGEGPRSDIEATTKNPKPGRPTGLTARAAGSTIIDLSWTAPTDTGTSAITGYKIEVSTNAGSSWSDLEDDTENTNRTYNHTGLTAGTTRHYRVSAINGSGPGEESDTAAATTTSGQPTPPRNLSATADGKEAIDLEWDAPADTGTSKVLHYKIEERTSGTSSWDSIAGTGPSTTDYERTGLSAGTKRYYRVFAVNSTGPSDASNVDSATTAAAGQAPDPPENLRATADGQEAIDLDWDAPSDHGSSRIIRYKIEESSNGTSWDSIAGTDSTTTDYKRRGLSAGTTRHYRVRAVNSDGPSDPSDTASATTRATAEAPSPPTDLEATADGPNAIDLSWTAPSDTGSSNIVGYRIEASEDDTTSWRVIQSNTRSRTTSYEHTGLDPGDTYYYRVSAINDDATSDPSNVDNATTDAERPGPPRDLDAVAVDSVQITLTWNPPEDDGGSPITGYRIEWSPNGTSGWDDLDANTGSTATSYTDTLSPNTTRHYRVSAINGAGTGPPSDVASATTSGTVPGQPTNLAASARDTAQIDLVWRAPSDDGGSPITGYRIEVSDDARSWVDLERDTEDDNTNYSHTNLSPGSLRYYRVSAINSVGTGRPSRLDFATTLDVPGRPTDLRATPDGETTINLEWTRPASDGGSPIEGYRIDVSENSGATWTVLVANSQSTGTGYSHTGLSAGDTRHYRVFAINEWGRGESSNIAHATTDATVPDPPRNLSADATGQTRIDLDWDPPAGDGGSEVTGYRIEVSPNGHTWSDLERNTGRTTTRYAHTGLDPGSTRHYRVSAINSVGTGEASDTASATTAPAVPGAPSGLSAVADGTSQIDLSWTAPADDGGADITGYRVEVSDDGTSWRDLRSDTNSDDTEYSHTGLDPGTTQHYRVSAINAAGTGEPSEAASATTDPTVPDPPTGLSAAADGQTRIRLSWTAPVYDGGAPVTAYQVEVSADSADTWTVLSANTGNARTTFTHTGLEPGTTRHYRVAAVNVAGPGGPSNVAHATTDATVPDPPTDLAAAANGISQIDLAWTAPVKDGGAPVTGYRIEVSTTSGQTWRTLVTDTDNTSTMYSHTGLPPATRRDYRVSAVNRVGAGEPSNVADATTDPDLPDPPTDLAAQAHGSSRIGLSWNEPDYTGGVEITGYRIEVSADGGTTWTMLVGDTRSDDTDYDHTGLDPASTRHYRVFAINVAGMSEDYSNIAHATTDPIVPDAPTGLMAAADGTSRIDLSWTAPDYDGGADITGYRIEVSVDRGIVWKDLVENTGSTGTAYAHTGLDPATTRHYRVSAINRAGTGAPSNTAEATTDATVPDAPTRLSATADGTAQIDLSWATPGFDGGAEITGYRIEVSLDAGNNWTDLVADTRSDDTEYSHTGLDPASTRHYRVSAINEIGTGDPSNVADATTDATVPDPPTNLVAVASSPTQIDLTWTAPAYDGGAPVTSYRIEVSEDGGTWSDLARSTGSAATAYSHAGLQPGSTRHYRVSAINVAGTGMPSAVATASTDDPVQRAGRVNEAILPHFAAAATSSTLGAIAARIEAVAARNPLPSQLRAAGLASLVGNLRGGGGLNTARLLNGTSFVMPLGDGAQEQQATEGFGAAAWGSAEYLSMGEPGGEEVEWEGGMISLHLGADMRVHRDFLAGMSASRSSGDYDFTDVTGAREVEGTYEARMNSVNPYLAWLPGRTGVALWAAGSFGWGDVAVDDGFAGRRQSDARTTTGAVGASRILVTNGASALRVRAEGWLSRVEVDEAEGMDSLTLDMERARFALEWSQVHKFRSGDEVTVLLEGGARFGDGEGTDGAGMEFGGGLRYANPTSGLTMEGHGRLLATGDSGYEEWGVRGLIQIDPQAAAGLSMKLAPTWGEPASGVQELWERGVSDRMGAAADMRKARLNAELEYGLAGFHGTPYGRVYLVDGGTRAFGTGMRYEVSGVLGLLIEGTRTHGVDAPARHGLALKGHWKFGG